MPIKHDYEYVKKYIEDLSYNLIDETYKNGKQKLKLLCPSGHVCEIRFNDFKDSNVRCKEYRLHERRYSYDYVKNYIESYGYRLLSSEYQGSSSELDIKCPNGHEYNVTFNNFKSAGKRCRICFFENQKRTFEFVREQIEFEGYTLLSNSYEGANFKLLIRCPNDHEYKTTFKNFYYCAARCKQCYINTLFGETNPRWTGNTPLNKRIRKTKRYIEWRTNVFERDSYTCQVCGKYGGILNAHHIENFSSNEDLRFDHDNGITLCFECHHQGTCGSFHNLYGTSNNTREQLIEFINMKMRGFENGKAKNRNCA